MRQYLVQTIVTPYSKKSLFGKKYMLFKDYYNQSAILSIYCVVLGYTYKNKIEAFMEMFTNSKSETKKYIDAISEMGEEVEKRRDIQTKNMTELFLDTQIKKYIETFHKGENLDYRNPQDLMKIKNHKIPLKIVITLSELMIYSLVGFGYKYPDLAEKFLTYKVDNETYELAVRMGVEIPKESISMEEHINLSKELIKPYVQKYHSDLVNDLELK